MRVFGIFIAFTLAAVVFTAPFVAYAACRTFLALYGVPLALLGAGLSCALVIGFQRVRAWRWPERRFTPVALLLGVLLFLAQLYVVKSAGFITTWDVATITQVGDRLTEAGADITYFSHYPNQLFLYGLFAKIAKVGAWLGIGTYTSLVVGGCACVALSVVLATFVCRRLIGPHKALVFQAVASLYLGLNGWIMVPYSDSYGILFCTAALFFYAVPRRWWVRWVGMITTCALGYMVKPTALAILGAAALVSLLPRAISAVRDVRAGKARLGTYAAKAGLLACVVVASLALATGIGVFIRGNYLQTEPRQARTAAHYLMMGLNPEVKGVYSKEDNEFSDSFTDPDERVQAQLGVWWDRLCQAGPLGVAKLFYEKNLSDYADGSFGWKKETHSDFFYELVGDNWPVREFYGVYEDFADEDVSLTRGLPYYWLCHAAWLATLGGCVLSMRRRVREAPQMSGDAQWRRHNEVLAAMALALLILSAYLMVFECRARYLFVYSPYFLIIGIDGILGADWAGALRRFMGLEAPETRGAGEGETVAAIEATNEPATISAAGAAVETPSSGAPETMPTPAALPGDTSLIKEAN